MVNNNNKKKHSTVQRQYKSKIMQEKSQYHRWSCGLVWTAQNTALPSIPDSFCRVLSTRKQSHTLNCLLVQQEQVVEESNNLPRSGYCDKSRCYRNKSITVRNINTVMQKKKSMDWLKKLVLLLPQADDAQAESIVRR